MTQRFFIFESLVLVPALWVFLHTYLGFRIRRHGFLIPIYLIWATMWVLCFTSDNSFLDAMEEHVRPINMMALAFVLSVLVYKAGQNHNSFYRDHLLSISAGLGFVGLCFFLNGFIVDSNVEWSFSLGHLSGAVFLYMLFFALNRTELLNLELILFRITHLFLVAVIMGLIYNNLIVWIGGDDPEWLFFNTVVATIVLFGVFEPFEKLTQWIYDRLFGKRQANFSKKVRAEVESRREQIRSQDLLEQSHEYLSHFFPVDAMALYFTNSFMTYFIQSGSRSSTPHSPFPVEIAAHHFSELPEMNIPDFILDARNLKARLQVVDDSYDRYVVRKWIDFLSQTNATALIPLKPAETVMGFILLQTPQVIKRTRFIQKNLESFFKEVAVQLKQYQLFEQSTENERIHDLGLMAAGLAHELKNPMSSIHGAAQILAGTLPSQDKSQEFIQMILKETNRMNALVHQILQFSRQDSQSKTLLVDLSRVIQLSLNRVAISFAQNLDIMESNFGHAPLFIDSRPELLDLIFSNLFQNILEAHQRMKQPPSLVGFISVHHQHMIDLVGQDWIQVDIADKGEGIPQEILDKIFVPLVSTKPRGSGLGMSLVKKAVDSLGAKIQVTSRVGVGTKYSLFFRVTNAVKTNQAHEQTRKVKAYGASEFANSYR